MESLVIATIKSWNILNAKKFKERWEDQYRVYLITKKDELTLDRLKRINPRFIFFPHWSWIIPREIYENFECVVFHTADLPYGRGGSPLQNLIVRGVKWTKVSALRVDGGIDTGPIYLKKDVFIGLGSAEEIFIEISRIIFEEMIPEILEKRPQPVLQKGEVLEFRRRRPDESEISPEIAQDLRGLYDFIRMLDAEGYPRAFIRLGRFRVLLSEPHLRSDRLCGRFEIIEDSKDENSRD